jgi:hypothetical protein
MDETGAAVGGIIHGMHGRFRDGRCVLLVILADIVCE